MRNAPIQMHEHKCCLIPICGGWRQVGRDSRRVMRTVYECFKSGADPEAILQAGDDAGGHDTAYALLVRLKCFATESCLSIFLADECSCAVHVPVARGAWQRGAGEVHDDPVHSDTVWAAVRRLHDGLGTSSSEAEGMGRMIASGTFVKP